MSQLTASTVRITDIDILRKAVKGFDGLTWNEGATRFRSYGSSNPEYQKELLRQMKGTCEHSITVKGASHDYQIGVIKNEDGDYVLAYDEDDKGIMNVVGSQSNKLIAAYGEALARDWAEKKGFMVETGYDEEGNLRLTMIDPN